MLYTVTGSDVRKSEKTSFDGKITNVLQYVEIDGIWLDFLSAFHSTKIPKFSNGTEISRESFQKIRELLNLGKANYSTEDSGNSRMKIKLNGKFQYTSGDCFL